MNQTQIFTGLIALIVGLGAGYLFWGGPTSTAPAADHSMHQQMNSMTSSLQGKSGDEFDKTFLSEMIVHHEGAVEMAEAALKNAQHEEIKQMANAIISAQTSEITQMKGWLSAWYGE